MIGPPYLIIMGFNSRFGFRLIRIFVQQTDGIVGPVKLPENFFPMTYTAGLEHKLHLGGLEGQGREGPLMMDLDDIGPPFPQQTGYLGQGSGNIPDRY
jgi:hypothetical protein